MKTLLHKLLLLATLAISGFAAAAPAGYVHDVKGSVTLRDAGKQAAAAKVGDTFEQGANFTTGTDGQVTLKFEDGQVAMLAANTQFIVTTYSYNKNRVAEGNIVFNLARGGLRFISGVLAETNPSRFAVRTPTATAGVRGSAGGVTVSQDGQTVTASTSKGVVTLQVGNTTVSIPVGSISAAQGQSMLTGNTAIPASVAASTPGLAQVAVLIQTLAAVNASSAPPNNPINVASTAAAISLAVQAAANPGNAALQAQAAAALQTAVADTQTAIAAAVAGGAAAGAGSDTGGTAPAPDAVVVPPTIVPPAAPATPASSG